MKKKSVPLAFPQPAKTEKPAFIFGVSAGGRLCSEQMPAGWTTTRITNGLQIVNGNSSVRECFTVLYSHTEHGGAGVLVLWTGKEGEQKVLYDDLTENAAETFTAVVSTIKQWLRKRGHR